MRRHRIAVLAEEPPQSQPHRKKKRKRHRAAVSSTSVSSETSYADGPHHHHELNSHTHYTTIVCEKKPEPEQSKASVGGDGFSFRELRQRSLNNGGDSAVTTVDDGYGKEVSSVGVAASETVESLELKRVLAEDSISKKSPVTYLLEKVCHGNSVWNTTTIWNEKGRERVYDTIFRLPWRCEVVFVTFVFSS